MAGIFKRVYDWLLRLFWATEMDITMIGLQNAGKTSLLRVLAVSYPRPPPRYRAGTDCADGDQGGEFTLEYVPQSCDRSPLLRRLPKASPTHLAPAAYDLG